MSLLKYAVSAFALFLFGNASNAQLIQSEVISCYGAENSLGNTDFMVSSTCGEAVAESVISASLNFNGGFQQGTDLTDTSTPWNQESKNLIWQVYPNPGNGQFQIKQINLETDFRNTDFRILDSKGKLIQTGALSVNRTLIIMDEPIAGVYFLHIGSITQEPICLPLVIVP